MKRERLDPIEVLHESMKENKEVLEALGTRKRMKAKLTTVIFCPRTFLQSYLDRGYAVLEVFTATRARFSNGKPAQWYTLKQTVRE